MVVILAIQLERDLDRLHRDLGVLEQVVRAREPRSLPTYEETAALAALRSDDAGVRDEATAVLSAVPEGLLPVLDSARRRATDPEVRLRLDRVIRTVHRRSARPLLECVGRISIEDESALVLLLSNPGLGRIESKGGYIVERYDNEGGEWRTWNTIPEGPWAPAFVLEAGGSRVMLVADHSEPGEMWRLSVRLGSGAVVASGPIARSF